jgi:POT family proton-dependent oligopeptide transporter
MGYGLFKPSLASLVGSLFPCKDHLRDYAFSILYISVTLGIFAAGVIGGWFENENTLPLVFFVSGIFVVISLLLFLLSLKWQNSIAEPEVSNSLNQNSSEPLSEQEKSHVKFLAILAIFAIMFYAAHNEGGALLSIYLKRYTDRVVGGVEIPAPWFTAWGAFLTTLLTIGINRIWRLLDEYKKEPPLIYKIAFGLSCTGLSFIVLALAAWYTHPSVTNKTPIYWILIFQIIFVFAKACVNPLLWSATSRLAPKRYHSLYMGLMLGCISLGHLLGGGINSYITQIGYEGLFLLTSILMITASSLLALLKPYLTSLVDYKDQVNRK